MRTVLDRSAGRASFILVNSRMVGSVAFPAVPVESASRQITRKYDVDPAQMP
jgi:hypothetical protein